MEFQLGEVGLQFILFGQPDEVPVKHLQGGLGGLSQGVLEISNVSVVEEMVNLITGQRAYEINSKAIQASDEMLQTAANLRR